MKKKNICMTEILLLRNRSETLFNQLKHEFVFEHVSTSFDSFWVLTCCYLAGPVKNSNS